MNPQPNNWHLSRYDKRFLGVCGGVAECLDIPSAFVRIAFVICCFLWGPLIFAYLICYVCLNKEFSFEKVQEYFTRKHDRHNGGRINYRRAVYRRRYNKRIAGVCAGLADYLGINPFAIRMAALFSFFFLGPFTFLGYIICWIAIPKEPRGLGEQRPPRGKRRGRTTRRERAEMEAEEEMAYSRADEADMKSTGANLDECISAFSRIERRLREMEAYITSKKFQLHCEIKRI